MDDNIIEHITAELPVGPQTRDILIKMYNLRIVQVGSGYLFRSATLRHPYSLMCSVNYTN